MAGSPAFASSKPSKTVTITLFGHLPGHFPISVRGSSCPRGAVVKGRIATIPTRVRVPPRKFVAFDIFVKSHTNK